jgi:hypothetical protein
MVYPLSIPFPNSKKSSERDEEPIIIIIRNKQDTMLQQSGDKERAMDTRGG